MNEIVGRPKGGYGNMKSPASTLEIDSNTIPNAESLHVVANILFFNSPCHHPKCYSEQYPAGGPSQYRVDKVKRVILNSVQETKIREH